MSLGAFPRLSLILFYLLSFLPYFCQFPVPERRDGEMGVERLAISSHGLFYPVDILADLGIDTWVVGLAARETAPGHHALQGTFAHEWSP